MAASGRKATRLRVALYLPDTRFGSANEVATDAEVVIIGLPDDLIPSTVADLAGQKALGPDQHVIHLSGSLGLDALDPARAAGAEVLSLHPLQSFPDEREGIARLPDSHVAVTAHTNLGFAFGQELVRDVGAEPFRLADEAKPLYHAAAVFASNYLVAVEAVAEQLFRQAGVRNAVKKFEPLARSSLDAALSRGPREALTGPAVRGDAGTIQRNLEALAAAAPETVAPYVALARVAGGMALRAGRISVEDRERMEEVLDEWN